MRAVVACAVLVLVAMLMAGCVKHASSPVVGAPIVPSGKLPPGCDAARPAVVHHSGGIVAPSAGVHLAVPCLVRTGFTSGEPTIGVCPKTGTVFEFPAGASGRAQGHGAARSVDEGGNWTRVVPNLAGVATHQSSLDPYFYLDPATCRIFVDDWVADCTQISYSDDEGSTWHESVNNCGQFDHQTIFAGPAPAGGMPTVGYPNVVYQCAINLVGVAEGSFATTCQKSLDGGLTWLFTGAPPYVADPTLRDGRYGVPGICDGATGHGWVDGKGSVYLPKGLCGKPMLAISHDEGATWTRVQVSDLGMSVMTSQQGAFYEHEAAVGSDADGTLYYAWAAADRMPWLATSKDGGATWSKPVMAGAPGLKEAALVQLAVGAPGHVALVYMGSTNSPGDFPTKAACSPEPAQCAQDVVGSEPQGAQPPEYDNVTWNGYMTLSADALDPDPTFQSAALNDPTDPLVRGICAPVRCGAESDFLDIRIGPDGTPWASLVDGCIDACVQSGTGDNAGLGIVGRLWGGPSLLANPLAAP
jgi:hypothetical protein